MAHKGKTFGAAIVAQQVMPPPTMQAPPLRAPACVLAVPLWVQLSAHVHLGRQQRMAHVLEPLKPTRRPGGVPGSSLLFRLDPGACGHLENKPADKRSLSLPSLSVSLCFKSLNKILKKTRLLEPATWRIALSLHL